MTASSGQSLMFNAHVDVVPPGSLTRGPAAALLRARRRRHAARPGACDMKAGLAAAYWAVAALVRAARHCGPT